jgi:hypothetical protein
MSKPITHINSITLITATFDNTVIGVYKTRMLIADGVPPVGLADSYEANDIDAFANAPFDGKHGVTVTVYAQQTPNWCIPDGMWIEYFELLKLKITMEALSRKTTCETNVTELSEMPIQDGQVGLLMIIPSYAKESTTTINGRPVKEVIDESPQATYKTHTKGNSNA